MTRQSANCTGPETTGGFDATSRKREIGRRHHRLGSLDEEDVALSAFKSFCLGAAKGSLGDIKSRDELWRLLYCICISARKANGYVRHQTRQKRGGGTVAGESSFGRLQSNDPLFGRAAERMMLSPKLYKNSHTYDFFIRMLGYERSIERFLRSLDVDGKPNCRILDAGCGTGLLGFHFLQRFSDATLIATDLEPNFLRAAITNAKRRGIALDRIKLGIANISTPHRITSLEGDPWELQEGSLDVICVGAVLGYADDTEASILQLLKLLAPGGYLINLEMNESFVGRFISHRYHYDIIDFAQIRNVIRQQGYEVSTKKLKIQHLPAKLTRTAIIARKPD